MHVDKPVADAIVPATHGVHDPALAPLYCPSAQLRHAITPPVEYVPAEQGVHADCPARSVYCPATHATQLAAPADAANVPLVHAVHALDPAAAYCPALQVMQPDADAPL